VFDQHLSSKITKTPTMKLSAALIAAVVSLAAHDASGFLPPHQHRSASMMTVVDQPRSLPTSSSLKMAEQTEVEKLRAAAAKAREEAARLAKVRTEPR
jgi:hypothetical protein